MRQHPNATEQRKTNFRRASVAVKDLRRRQKKQAFGSKAEESNEKFRVYTMYAKFMNEMESYCGKFPIML